MSVTPETGSSEDATAVSEQLGRPARGIRSIAHRCSCGLPDVAETEPRLPDGTPFPTTYYVTCPRLASAIGRLEAEGVMKEMTERLGRTRTSLPAIAPRTRTTCAGERHWAKYRRSRASALVGCRRG